MSKPCLFPASKCAALVALLVAAASTSARAVQIDLTPAGTQTLTLTGAFGGTAIVTDFFVQPAGTGVFNPFLTLDANGQTSTGSNQIEQAYNTAGFNALYLDGLRPNWNTTLKVSDLAALTVNGTNYFGFILDANEPGGSKSTISIDNIRIYTSASDNTAAVGDNLSNLDNLGTLRWAMNSPTVNPDGSFNMNNWITLDANQENIAMGSNGGSGMADMAILIPQTAFNYALPSDYVWFYNLNGVHSSADKNLASTAGYEEWSAVRAVPESASPLALLVIGIVGLRAGRRHFATRRR